MPTITKEEKEHFDYLQVDLDMAEDAVIQTKRHLDLAVKENERVRNVLHMVANVSRGYHPLAHEMPQAGMSPYGEGASIQQPQPTDPRTVDQRMMDEINDRDMRIILLEGRLAAVLTVVELEIENASGVAAR